MHFLLCRYTFPNKALGERYQLRGLADNPAQPGDVSVAETDAPSEVGEEDDGRGNDTIPLENNVSADKDVAADNEVPASQDIAAGEDVPAENNTETPVPLSVLKSYIKDYRKGRARSASRGGKEQSGRKVRNHVVSMEKPWKC